MMSCKKICALMTVATFCVLPTFVGADTYVPLADIPALESAAESTDQGFSSFINTIYRMSIGLGSALAVIMIIFAGIQYSMSSVGGKKAELKEKITMALGGLALLLGAFIFLEFVNPDLVELEPKQLSENSLSDDQQDEEIDISISTE